MELEVFCLCLQYTDPMLYSHYKPIVIYTDYCIVHMSSLGKYCFMLFIQQIMKYLSIAIFFWCKLPVSRSHRYIYFCDSCNCVNYGRKHNIRNYIGLCDCFWGHFGTEAENVQDRRAGVNLTARCRGGNPTTTGLLGSRLMFIQQNIGGSCSPTYCRCLRENSFNRLHDVSIHYYKSYSSCFWRTKESSQRV